jgi:tRNA(Ile)-lysidine synthase
MSHEFERKLAAAWPPTAWCDVTVLVAVSGGADSVALLRGLAAIRPSGRGRLVVAHANHQLRDAAAADAAFVETLCRTLQVPCELGVVTVGPIAGDGLEAAARAARYQFLEAAAGRFGARYLVTAHTADDQAETVLQRILRGTGIRGLAGISRVRPLGPASLLRPLLGCRRAELRAYLAAIGQDYRHDASNDELRFTRNRIRHELLPQLAGSYHPNVVENVLRLATLAGEAQGVIETLVGELRERAVCVERCENAAAVRIERRAVAEAQDYVLRELLADAWRRQGWPEQDMGRRQWELLAAMLREGCPGQKQLLPGGVLAECDDAGLRLQRP